MANRIKRIFTVPLSLKILIVFVLLSFCVLCDAKKTSETRQFKDLTTADIPGMVFSQKPIFGVAFGETYKGEKFMSYIHELGANLTKIYLHWHWIEPQKNSYDWRLVDRFINQLGEEDEALIAVFTSSPWGAGGVGKGYPPKNYDDYYSFIYNLVKHCRGKIKYWQRDTEPASPRHWDKMRAEEYVKTQKYFYKAVKKADPNAFVIDVSMNGVFVRGNPQSKDFFEYVLKFGKDYFDILDIRLYWDIYGIPHKVNWFKQKMSKFGYKKPIVTTEYGGPTPVQFSEFKEVRRKLTGGKLLNEQGSRRKAWQELNQSYKDLPPSMQMFLKHASKELDDKRHRINCRDLVQRTIIALNAGVEKFWYWNLISRSHPKFGPHPIFGKLRLMDDKFKIRYPSFYAYKDMVKNIGDIRSIKKIDTGDVQIYLFKILKAKDKIVYVVWQKRDLFHGEDHPASSLLLALPHQRYKINDIFGKKHLTEFQNGKLFLKVSGTPLYLEPT
jgi:hypothetical protein